MKYKELSEARFDALTYSRDPFLELIGREYKWYSDNDEIIIGVLVLDIIDNDWIYVVLGRDERALFRSIDVMVGFENIEAAEKELLAKISYYVASGKIVFPQGTNKNKKNLIFKPVVSDEKIES